MVGHGKIFLRTNLSLRWKAWIGEEGAMKKPTRRRVIKILLICHKRRAGRKARHTSWHGSSYISIFRRELSPVKRELSSKPWIGSCARGREHSVTTRSRKVGGFCPKHMKGIGVKWSSLLFAVGRSRRGLDHASLHTLSSHRSMEPLQRVAFF